MLVPPSTGIVSVRGEARSARASLGTSANGHSAQPSSRWWTISTGTAMRARSISVTGRSCQFEPTRIVEVSTTPSGPPAAAVGSCVATYAADCVPRLVPISHTGTRASARSHAISARTSATCCALWRKSPRYGGRARSDGGSTTATAIPRSANIARVRTRKFPPFVSAPPEPMPT